MSLIRDDMFLWTSFACLASKVPRYLLSASCSRKPFKHILSGSVADLCLCCFHSFLFFSSHGEASTGFAHNHCELYCSD